MAAGTRELFVYWRLERHDRTAACAALQRFQAGLEADWPGLVARLYERADDDGSGQATVMETYAREGGIPPGLQADIVALGTQAAGPWCRGPRHVEAFDALPR